MARKAPLLEEISLKGLEIAPSQVWGNIRLVPLLRQNVRPDLRLFKRDYHSDLTIVSVDKRTRYFSCIPHGLILHWSEDGQPVVATGGQLLTESNVKDIASVKMQLLQRMVKRETKQSLRLLPLHLAMEGFLSLFFGGPSVAWKNYSKQALSNGLSPRVEWSISGRSIVQLNHALRLFEIHDRQVGVLLFVSEVLASAFVVPTPTDYRALHTSILEDFYGETFLYHGLYGGTSTLNVEIDAEQVHTLDDLKVALKQVRSDWANFQGFMASNLLNVPLQSKRIYRAGPFSLQRFMTTLELKQQNYIGEAILDDHNQLQYLKIYGLSAAQTKRAYLLKQIAAHNWNLERTAQSENDTLAQFIYRLEKVGFGYLVNNQLREQAAKERRPT